jgi:hypothetical protein
MPVLPCKSYIVPVNKKPLTLRVQGLGGVFMFEARVILGH